MLQWMQEIVEEYYHQTGEMFSKAKSLLHLTITGGEPFVRNDLTG